ncbi:MAG TPA: nucleotidyl transferase AbiEii/AbiGii toxin family protein [bacterium]|nr:nucleotidyl transferase AbiEii/AbiGii toxin family protein [bacterium]
MIPQKNLLMLANRLLREGGGKRIQEQVLERDYCISWILAGLDKADIKDKIVFKGGTALKKCYFIDYRFSEDLDFTLNAEIGPEDIIAGLNPVFDFVKKSANITMGISGKGVDTHINSHTFYLSYAGPLPASSTRELKVDITIEEKLVEAPVVKPLLSYREYSDVPEGAGVRVYSLNEIAVEKIAALSDKARNEARDLYDLWYLLENGLVKITGLTGALAEKLEFRGRKPGDINREFVNKEARLEKLWSGRLSHQMEKLPGFDSVYRLVKKEFRKAGL